MSGTLALVIYVVGFLAVVRPAYRWSRRFFDAKDTGDDFMSAWAAVGMAFCWPALLLIAGMGWLVMFRNERSPGRSGRPR